MSVIFQTALLVLIATPAMAFNLAENAAYANFWAFFFDNMFKGILGYALAVLFLVLGYWTGYRRQNYIVAGCWFAATAIICFGENFAQYLR